MIHIKNQMEIFTFLYEDHNCSASNNPLQKGQLKLLFVCIIFSAVMNESSMDIMWQNVQTAQSECLQATKNVLFTISSKQTGQVSPSSGIFPPLIAFI